MELLGQVAESYKALVTYDLGEAVRLFQGLPPHHWDTPWVLTQVAHAYFAAERFKKVSGNQLTCCVVLVAAKGI